MLVDLASAAVGGSIVACNDEFFAPVSNLLNPVEPVWKEGEYTDRGKWMDGWETRRRRESGHDWCEIVLGIPGRVRRVVVDTSHFTGNYPESFSLEAAVGDPAGEDWAELIPRSELRGDTIAEFEVDDPHRVTRLRLRIYPDGGVARLRVLGTPIPALDEVCQSGTHIDLASLTIGGAAVDASDTHYSPPSNLLRPTEPMGMWDGWETRRRRGPGHDWAVFRLGVPGVVHSVVVDTTHFKGNAPGWVSVDASEDGAGWEEVLPQVAVKANEAATLDLEEPAHAGLIRLNIHPDGGLARFRVMGIADSDQAAVRRLEYVNALFPGEAAAFFRGACAATTWVQSMVGARPFSTAPAALEAADQCFDGLTDSDWLEAFAGHPRIGDRGDRIADREQAGTASASRTVLRALADANQAYEQEYGFTFIVYATGKTADEMLDILRSRLGRTRGEEIAAASIEQRSITRTRLRRMLCLGSSS